MSLLVLGAPQALATAVLAAAVSGERVVVDAEGMPSALPTRALRHGTARPIDLAPVVGDGEIHACVIVAEARDLPALVEERRGLLHGLPVLLAPGGLAGALRVAARDGSLQVAESTGFPVAGAVEGDAFVLRGEKHSLPFAAADSALTDRLLGVFRPYLPQLVESTLLTTSMSNTNHLIHPPITLMNSIRVDSAASFTLYREGVSESLEHLLVAVDEERRAVCRAVGADDRSARDWLLGFYRADGMRGDTLVSCLTSYPGFETVPGPTTLDYRYLADDVPHGVAQWAALGRRLGVPTPTIDHLLAMLAVIAPALALEADQEGLDLFLAHVRRRRTASVPQR